MLAGLIGLGVGSLVGAIVLRAAAQWLEKLDVPFGNALLTMLLVNIANSVVGLTFAFAFGTAARSNEVAHAARAAIWPACFLIQSAIIGRRIELPMGRACLVSFVMVLISIGIGLAIVVPLILVSRFLM